MEIWAEQALSGPEPSPCSPKLFSILAVLARAMIKGKVRSVPVELPGARAVLPEHRMDSVLRGQMRRIGQRMERDLEALLPQRRAKFGHHVVERTISPAAR